MTDLHLALKLVHVLGAAILFGTGLGIAFFMWMAHRSGDPSHIAQTARVVVIADALFTASAVVLQPLTGILLAYSAGYSLLESWLVASVALYVLIGACWLPVVLIQMKLRDLAAATTSSGEPCRNAIGGCSVSGSGSAGRLLPALLRFSC